MSEPESVQQSSWGRKVLGCLIGLLGVALTLGSLLFGVCTVVFGGPRSVDDLLGLAAICTMGIALLFVAFGAWRRP